MLNNGDDAWEVAWQAAMDNYKPAQKLLLGQIKSPEDASSALLTARLHQESTKSFVIMNKIQRVLDGIKIFEDAMKIYSNCGVGELCLLWGSVTLVLQVHSKSSFVVAFLLINGPSDGVPSHCMFRKVLGSHGVLLRKSFTYETICAVPWKRSVSERSSQIVIPGFHRLLYPVDIFLPAER